MSNAVTLTGQIVAGPSASSDSSFPSGLTNIPFNLNPPQKPYTVDTGSSKANVNSSGSFVTLSGVGASGVVTQAQFFYARATTSMQLRLTFNNPGLSDIVSVIPLDGVLVIEPDPSRYLKLVEVMGAGLVEYYAAGLM